MDVKTVLLFLERFSDEVTGHGQAEAPGAEMLARLKRFSQGECSAQERAEVCAILRQDPTWLRWLAERVKENRPARKKPAARSKKSAA